MIGSRVRFLIIVLPGGVLGYRAGLIGRPGLPMKLLTVLALLISLARHPVAAELPAILSDQRTVADGRLLTGRGAGTSLDFALLMVTSLVSAEKAAMISAAIAA